MVKPTRTTVDERHGQLRVLYFWVKNPDYPRNSRIRAYLEEEWGARIDIVPASRLPRLRRYGAAFAAALRARSGKYDLVVLSEMSLEMAGSSWLAAKLNGAIHLVDFFVGLVETEVEDARRTSKHSLRGRQLDAADRVAVASSDFAVTDTRVRASRFGHQYGRGDAFSYLPVGAPQWARSESSRTLSRPTKRVLFYGNYLRLHGLDVIAAALDELRRRRTLEFEAVFIGRGPGFEDFRSDVDARELSEIVTLVPPVRPEELASWIASSDVVLGVFGESMKAREVIPNKVWQGLYSGATVVTMASPALEEIADIAGAALVQTPRDATDLADAIEAVLQAKKGHDSVHLREELEGYVNAQFGNVFRQILSARERKRRR